MRDEALAVIARGVRQAKVKAENRRRHVDRNGLSGEIGVAGDAALARRVRSSTRAGSGSSARNGRASD